MKIWTDTYLGETPNVQPRRVSLRLVLLRQGILTFSLNKTSPLLLSSSGIIMTFYNFNHKRATLSRIGQRYFIGRNLNYAWSFEDDLFAMPVRPSQLGGGAGFNQTESRGSFILRLFINSVKVFDHMTNCMFISQ